MGGRGLELEDGRKMMGGRESIEVVRIVIESVLLYIISTSFNTVTARQCGTENTVIKERIK